MNAAYMLILCCSFASGDVVYDYNDYDLIPTEPTYEHLWPNSAVKKSIFDRCDDESGIGSDGLMCWNDAWADNATDPNNLFSFCPTIANQFNFEFTATAQIDKVMGSVQFDYSSCGFDFGSLTPEDKQMLRDVTVELEKMQILCRFAIGRDDEAQIFNAGTARDNSDEYRPLRIFDNVGCYTLEDYLHVTVIRCPMDPRYFQSVIHIDDRGLNNYTKESLTDEGYSLGWNCFKDEVKNLLKTVRVDKYFKPGCAEFTDDKIHLPYTALGEEVEVKCKKSKPMDLIDDSRSITFKCSNYAEWEGNRNFGQRRECINKDVQILLSLTKRCPSESDGISQWSATRFGHTATKICPRHILGYDTEQDLCNMIEWNVEGHYSRQQCNMQNYRFNSVVRQCSDSGEWQAPDYSECLEALPKPISMAYKNLERD